MQRQGNFLDHGGLFNTGTENNMILTGQLTKLNDSHGTELGQGHGKTSSNFIICIPKGL